VTSTCTLCIYFPKRRAWLQVLLVEIRPLWPLFSKMTGNFVRATEVENLNKVRSEVDLKQVLYVCEKSQSLEVALLLTLPQSLCVCLRGKIRIRIVKLLC